jgi:hypothetical protein
MSTTKFDINNADFLSVLEACHARILQIQKADEKRHMMDVDICHQWIGHLEETLMPAIEAIIYDEPTDDEINAPLHA